MQQFPFQTPHLNILPEKFVIFHPQHQAGDSPKSPAKRLGFVHPVKSLTDLLPHFLPLHGISLPLAENEDSAIEEELIWCDMSRVRVVYMCRCLMMNGVIIC